NMKGFLLLITICFSSVSFGQQAIFEWEKSFGGSDFDEAYCIDQTDDGGYIVVGHSTSNDGDLNYNYGIRDCYILKLDATGHKMWQKIFGGTGTESIQSIQQTSDGGYIAAGYSNSNDFDVIGNHGGFDFWILKLDVFGNIIWQRSLGGSFTEHAYSIKQTSDGGYIVTGDASSNDGDLTVNYYGSDFWVVMGNSKSK
ncbi:T9SS C-terminal target domain-containing protein, partial [Crocinitomicaceae bacterium]|nr:T9SS C-terminal target domain-containing protein [Crocinitomicaceae bacterium]